MIAVAPSLAKVTVVYCRLSADDPEASRAGVESCDVQAANARRFVEKQRWTGEIVVITDDGVSGAEIVRRIGLQELLTLARESCVRRVVVRDLDRLARDAMYQAWILAEFDRARVEVWSYVDGARPELRGLGYAMTALKGVMAEQERAATAKRVREALRFRAETGRSVGFAGYGYRVESDDKGNKRDVIELSEAARLVEIAEVAVAAGSLSAGARKLNSMGVSSPRGSYWRAQTLKHVLQRPRLRGLLIHGDERQIPEAGTLKRVSGQPDALRIERPELRIFSQELEQRIDAMLAGTSGRRRRPAGAATPRHLAVGFVRCPLCGHGLTAIHPSTRAAYACSWHASRGTSVCVGLGYRKEALVDEALLEAVSPLLDGEVARRALDRLRRRLQTSSAQRVRQADCQRLRRALGEAERESSNLVTAIARGDAPEPLLDALRARQKRIADLKAELERLSAPPPASLDGRRTLVAIEERLQELVELRAQGGVAARPVLSAVLGDAKFTAIPTEENGQRRWTLTAKVAGGYLLSNVVNGGGCPGTESRAPGEGPGARPRTSCGCGPSGSPSRPPSR
jgi:DNA invertase Pin-like site-specific DNA recombinase